MTLDKRYDEVMEYIEVTPEMRQRILENIEQRDLPTAVPRKTVRFPHIRQLVTLAACLAAVLVGALTLPNLIQRPDNPDVFAPGDGIVQVGSVKELSEKVGFEINEWNSLPFHVEATSYTAYWQDVAEIAYSGEGQTAVYRKGIGSEDVSGDYNVYEAETKISAGDTLVTLKGDGGAYVLAIWKDGDYAYSISVSDEMSESSWEALLNQGLSGG